MEQRESRAAARARPPGLRPGPSMAASWPLNGFYGRNLPGQGVGYLEQAAKGVARHAHCDVRTQPRSHFLGASHVFLEESHKAQRHKQYSSDAGVKWRVTAAEQAAITTRRSGETFVITVPHAN